MTTVPVRVQAVMIDCRDPEALMSFWSDVPGVEVAGRYPDYIFSTPLPGTHISLAFQRVPEDKVVKNRLHLDVGHPDREAAIAKIVALGGTRVADHTEGGAAWTVMTDPEGNEFCITAIH